MKIYDAHIHAGRGIPNPYEFIGKLEKAGIYGGLVMSPAPCESTELVTMDYEDRMKNVFAWTQGYEGRLFPALWVHPKEDGILDKIDDAVDRGISAFKIICDNYYVYEDSSMKMIERIAKTGKPLVCHSGMLWTAGNSSIAYNRPVNWECLVGVPGLRFSLAHCGWPWHDEAIALYGRFIWSYRKCPGESAEIFFDLCPGTPKIYREELLNKLFNCGYDTPHNILFGVDTNTSTYNIDYAEGLIDADNKIYEKLGVTEDIKKLVYEDNFLRFMGKTENNYEHLPEWFLSDRFKYRKE